MTNTNLVRCSTCQCIWRRWERSSQDQDLGIFTLNLGAYELDEGWPRWWRYNRHSQKPNDRVKLTRGCSNRWNKTCWGAARPSTPKQMANANVVCWPIREIDPSTWQRSPQGRNIQISTMVFVSEVSRGWTEGWRCNSDIRKLEYQVRMVKQ